jgi:hypothetical protein
MLLLDPAIAATAAATAAAFWRRVVHASTNADAGDAQSAVLTNPRSGARSGRGAPAATGAGECTALVNPRSGAHWRRGTAALLAAYRRAAATCSCLAPKAVARPAAGAAAAAAVCPAAAAEFNAAAVYQTAYTTVAIASDAGCSLRVAVAPTIAFGRVALRVMALLTVPRDALEVATALVVPAAGRAAGGHQRRPRAAAHDSWLSPRQRRTPTTPPRAFDACWAPRVVTESLVYATGANTAQMIFPGRDLVLATPQPLRLAPGAAAGLPHTPAPAARGGESDNPVALPWPIRQQAPDDNNTGCAHSSDGEMSTPEALAGSSSPGDSSTDDDDSAPLALLLPSPGGSSDGSFSSGRQAQVQPLEAGKPQLEAAATGWPQLEPRQGGQQGWLHGWQQPRAAARPLEIRHAPPAQQASALDALIDANEFEEYGAAAAPKEKAPARAAAPPLPQPRAPQQQAARSARRPQGPPPPPAPQQQPDALDALIDAEAFDKHGAGGPRRARRRRSRGSRGSRAGRRQ